MPKPAELTVTEAARALKLHRTRIYQLLTEGRLARGPHGGITAKSVLTYRKTRRPAGRPPKGTQ